MERGLSVYVLKKLELVEIYKIWTQLSYFNCLLYKKVAMGSHYARLKYNILESNTIYKDSTIDKKVLEC